MDNINQKLQRCPFCGDQAECNLSASDDGVINMVICCTGCGAQITTGIPGPMDIKKATEAVESLVNKWNKRLEMKANFTDTDCDITYYTHNDSVITWIKGMNVSFEIDRTRLNETLEKFNKQHLEAQKGEWWFADEGFECSKCGYESRYMFTKCPGCNRTMKNGTEG